MRIKIACQDRPDLGRRILSRLAGAQIDLARVEVHSRLIYVDAPGLAPADLDRLRDALSSVDGVAWVGPIDMLPGERRALHWNALMAAFPDPVLAVDEHGVVQAANGSAGRLFGAHGGSLAGHTAGELLGEDIAGLVSAGVPVAREVSVAGRPFLLDGTPLPSLSRHHGNHHHDNHDGNEGPRDGDPPAGAMVVLTAPERVGRKLAALHGPDTDGFGAILGASAAIREAKERACRFAAVEAPVLVLGEAGAGKELFARAIHHASSRRDAPFLALNCAMRPENLVESDLFGYAPGAFDGSARGGKPGIVELADGGTVFLDEIGGLSPYVQAKLLRFLQDRSFRRIGGRRERRVDIRVISTTRRSLSAMVADSRFRKDLMHRLAVLTLAVPPLRQRRDDIPVLADRFLARAAEQVRRPAPALSPGAVAALVAHDWPGNVGELDNVLFRAVTLATSAIIDTADLGLGHVEGRPPTAGTDFETWAEAQARFESELLSRLYPAYPSTRKLARRLRVSHTMINDKLRTYGIRGQGDQVRLLGDPR